MHCALLADIGVPMIFVQWPLMICALLPVIAIEALVVRKRLALSYGRAFAGSAKANIVSTLAGVPLAWGLMLILEFAAGLPLAMAAYKWHWRTDSPLSYLLSVLGSAWIGPLTTSAWPIALAATVLLVPTFFVSVRLERRFYRRSYAEIDAGAVDRSVWFANVCSYTLLLVAAIVGALIFTARQVRAATEARRDQAAVVVIQTTQNASWTAALNLVSTLPENADAALVREKGVEMERALFELSIRFEPIGFMVFYRIIPLRAVDDLIGGVALVIWSRVKGWTAEYRAATNNPKFNEWVEWLADRISERRAKLRLEPAPSQYRAWREQ